MKERSHINFQTIKQLHFFLNWEKLLSNYENPIKLLFTQFVYVEEFCHLLDGTDYLIK